MLLSCTEGSPPSYLLLSAYECLFLVCLKVLRLLFIQFLWRTFFAFIWCRTPTHGCCGWYNDLCRDKSGLLEQVIIIVFSLHLGEPLVLDLAMLSFISLPYTVLHHDFQFLCLITFIEFISGWQFYDSWYNDWLFWILFLSLNLHVLPCV